MMYDAEKIAELTGVSKVTVYRKMKLEVIKSYIKLKNGKQFLNEEGFLALKDLLNITEAQERPTEEAQEASEGKYSLEYTNSLREQVSHLMKQIEVKDEQLKAQADNMAELIKSMQHSQFMLQEKEKELQEVKLLEQSSNAEDIQPDPVEEKPKKRGFLGIFSRR